MTAPPFLEIDTSDVVMAMIAANLAGADHAAVPVAGRSWLDQVAVLPLPGPGLARTLHQVSRQGEFEEMADAFWQYSRTALETEIFPQINARLPWLGRRMRLY